MKKLKLAFLTACLVVCGAVPLTIAAATAGVSPSAKTGAADADKSKQPKTEADPLVTEGIIEAPVDAVWAAFTTKEGQESWNVAHAEITLTIGGKMRTHYDAKGRIGDPNTIENRILSFEPKRMLSIQVTNPPVRFPFKDAIKNMWTVIYFEDAGPGRTRLRIVGLGFSNDEESRKLRDFFDKGNAYTLKTLQEKFAAKGGENSHGG